MRLSLLKGEEVCITFLPKRMAKKNIDVRIVFSSSEDGRHGQDRGPEDFPENTAKHAGDHAYRSKGSKERIALKGSDYLMLPGDTDEHLYRFEDAHRAGAIQ